MKDRQRNDDGYETCSSNGSSVAEEWPPGRDDAGRMALLARAVRVDMADDFDALTANAPDWIDPVRVCRGQKFAMDNYFGVSFSEALSLYVLFAVGRDVVLDTLIATRRSDTPYRAYRRYFETSRIVRSWMQTDILTAGTEGNKNLRKVFQMHRSVHKNMSRRSSGCEGAAADETAGCAAAASAIERVWCTALPRLREDLARVCGAAPVGLEWTGDGRTAFNQCYMSVTQFGFFGLALVHPERFGIHNYSRRDMEDFVHVWRTIGYYMGVRDEYNFGRGTLDEVMERSSWLIRALVVPMLMDVDAKWEHMSRCVAEGIRMYLKRAMPFETSFHYLCDVLGLHLVDFGKSFGLGQLVRLWWTAFLMRFALKYDCVKRWMNRAVFMRLSRAAKEFDDERVQSELKKTVFEYTKTSPEKRNTKCT